MTTNNGGEWFWQGAGEHLLNDIDFTLQQTGWAVSDNGSVLKSTNNGFNWDVNKGDMDSSLYSVDFINSYTGWAVGENGVIIKTTNGGE